MKFLFWAQAARRLAARLLQKFGLHGAVHYINGPETLPPPLTPEEEARVMERVRAGEENAREPLITHNLRLVVYIARKYESSNAGMEDLISIGAIGLIKAVNTFCPERNIKLATYASRCIENEILMFLRKHSQLRNEVSIDDPLNVDWDGNELLLSDVLGSDQDAVNVGVEQESERKLLLRAVSRLPPRDRKIMELRFGLGKRREHTQKEVADRLGIFPILYFPPGKENSETSFGRIWSMRAEEESGEKRSLCRKSVSFLQKTLALGLWIEYNQSEPDFGQRRPQGVFHTLADAFLLPRGGRAVSCGGIRSDGGEPPPFSRCCPGIDAKRQPAGRY